MTALSVQPEPQTGNWNYWCSCCRNNISLQNKKQTGTHHPSCYIQEYNQNTKCWQPAESSPLLQRDPRSIFLWSFWVLTNLYCIYYTWDLCLALVLTCSFLHMFSFFNVWSHFVYHIWTWTEQKIYVYLLWSHKIWTFMMSYFILYFSNCSICVYYTYKALCSRHHQPGTIFILMMTFLFWFSN